MTRYKIHPWRGCRIIRPNVFVSAAGTSTIASMPRTFVKGVGLAKGCAPLTLKNPPPFVPRFLMLSRAATGP